MQPQPPRPASEATLTPFIGNGTLLERKGKISCRTSSRFMMYEKKSLHGLRGRCRGLEARLYWQTSALLSLEERRCDDRHPRLRLLTRSKKSRRAGRPRVGPRPLTYLVVLQWFWSSLQPRICTSLAPTTNSVPSATSKPFARNWTPDRRSVTAAKDITPRKHTRSLLDTSVF